MEMPLLQSIDRVGDNDSKDLSNKTCEVLARINKQSPDIAGGAHGGKDGIYVGAGDQGVPSIKEVQKVIEMILVQSNDRVVDVPAQKQRQIPMAQTVEPYTEVCRSLRSFAWKIYKFDCRDLEEDSDESALTDEAPWETAHDCDEAWWESEKKDLEKLLFYEKDFEKGLEEMTISQLCTACRDFDLPTRGCRSLLIDRLVDAAIKQVERRMKKRHEAVPDKRGLISAGKSRLRRLLEGEYELDEDG